MELKQITPKLQSINSESSSRLRNNNLLLSRKLIQRLIRQIQRILHNLLGRQPNPLRKRHIYINLVSTCTIFEDLRAWRKYIPE